MASNKSSTSRKTENRVLEPSFIQLMEEIEQRKAAKIAKFRKKSLEIPNSPFSLIKRAKIPTLVNSNPVMDKQTKNADPALPSNITNITNIKPPVPLPRTKSRNPISSTPFGQLNKHENITISPIVFSPTHSRSRSSGPRRSCFPKSESSRRSKSAVGGLNITQTKKIEKSNTSLKNSPKTVFRKNKSLPSILDSEDSKRKENTNKENDQSSLKRSSSSSQINKHSESKLKRGRPRKIISTHNVSIQTSVNRKSDESERNDSVNKKSKKDATIQTSGTSSRKRKAEESKLTESSDKKSKKDTTIQTSGTPSRKRKAEESKLTESSDKKARKDDVMQTSGKRSPKPKSAKSVSSNKENSSDCFNGPLANLNLEGRSIDYVLDEKQRRTTGIKKIRVHRPPTTIKKLARNWQAQRTISPSSDSDSESEAEERLPRIQKFYRFEIGEPSGVQNLSKSGSSKRFLLDSSSDSGGSTLADKLTLHTSSYRNEDANISDYVETPKRTEHESNEKEWPTLHWSKQDYMDVLKLSPKPKDSPSKTASPVASQTRSKRDMTLSPKSPCLPNNQFTPKSILKSPTCDSTKMKKPTSARRSIVFEDLDSCAKRGRGRPRKWESFEKSPSPKQQSLSPTKVNSSLKHIHLYPKIIIKENIVVKEGEKPGSSKDKEIIVERSTRDEINPIEATTSDMLTKVKPLDAKNSTKDKSLNVSQSATKVPGRRGRKKKILTLEAKDKRNTPTNKSDDNIQTVMESNETRNENINSSRYSVQSNQSINANSPKGKPQSISSSPKKGKQIEDKENQNIARPTKRGTKRGAMQTLETNTTEIASFNFNERPKRIRKQSKARSYDVAVLNKGRPKKEKKQTDKKRKSPKKTVKNNNSPVPSTSRDPGPSGTIFKKPATPPKAKKSKVIRNSSVSSSTSETSFKKPATPKTENSKVTRNNSVNSSSSETSFKKPETPKTKNSKVTRNNSVSSNTSKTTFKKPETLKTQKSKATIKTTVNNSEPSSSSTLVKKRRGRPRKYPLKNENKTIENQNETNNNHMNNLPIDSGLPNSTYSSLNNDESIVKRSTRSNSGVSQNKQFKALIDFKKFNPVDRKSLSNKFGVFEISPKKTKKLDKFDHSMGFLVVSGEGTFQSHLERISIKKYHWLHVAANAEISFEAKNEKLHLHYYPVHQS